jgi:tetratricopeptide (TPR) repeat protein
LSHNGIDIDIQSRFEKANALRDSGRLEDAIQEFRLIARDTNDVDWKAAVLLGAARCYLDLGRLDDADNVITEIQSLAPMHEIKMDVSFVEACISSQKGDHRKAASQYGNMLREFTQLLSTTEHRDLYEEAYFRKAAELANSGEHREAIPMLKEAVSFSTLPAEDHQSVGLLLGICYEELGENDLAVEEYLRVIEFNYINRMEAETRYRVARLYYLRGAFAQTKYHLETYLKNYSEVVIRVPTKGIYELLSKTCTSLGEKENAKHYAKMSKNPNAK